MEKDNALSKKKEIDPKDFTTCDATIQMLNKAKRDGVETAFDRAASMKACPIGVESACCKHCGMGPCRLNARDPYGKVGVCGARITSYNVCYTKLLRVLLTTDQTVSRTRRNRSELPEWFRI